MRNATERFSVPVDAVASEGGMDYLVTRKRKLATVYLTLGVFTFVLLFPFYWMTITTFKDKDTL